MKPTQFRVLCVVLPLLSWAFITSGCCHSTGVLPFGPDTYTIKVGGDCDATKTALEEANAFAASKGKHMIPIEVKTPSRGELANYYELTFRLVDASDPEYRRTRPQRAPDAVIGYSGELDAEVNVSALGDNHAFTQLRQLKALRDDGILTEEEYQRAKQKLLED